jgi:hypothetical protein
MSKLISNDGLQTLNGCLRGDVMQNYFDLVARSSSGRFVSLCDGITHYMPGMPGNEHCSDVLLALTNNLGGQHLIRDYIAPCHIPGHWLAAVARRSSAAVPLQPSDTAAIPLQLSAVRISLYDPLGKQHVTARNRQLIISSHRSWLFQEYDRASTARPTFDILTVDADLPTQNDGESCGAFACCYVYSDVLHTDHRPSRISTGQIISPFGLLSLMPY